MSISSHLTWCGIPVFLFVALAGALVAAPPAPAKTQRVEITLSEEAGHPVSKYIYGQFIEHLGRCIYGGIWAEMLEDRKFFFPVTGDGEGWTAFTPGKTSWEGEGIPYPVLEASPWEIVGAAGALVMTMETPLAGEQNLRILLDANEERGIRQGHLGLKKGGGYELRMVARASGEVKAIAVELSWGKGERRRQRITMEPIAEGFTEYLSGTLAVDRATEEGSLSITATGAGTLDIGAVSLMPADHVDGFRADTLALLRQLNAPVYRWPGGNFVSGYDWRDGIGPRDRRPPRKNPAWKGIESNDVGIHEFMRLCELIGAEAYIAVNTGLGDAASAAAEVQYLNGAASTPMGALRAQHGHPEPFGVHWWAVGNEMYGDWQLGHMPLEAYTEKHRAMVEAMRAGDPEGRFVGVGHAGPWSEAMLRDCGDHMSGLSEHIYWQDKPDLKEHVYQVRDLIRKLADTHRSYRAAIPGLAGKQIPIIFDEWNYWYGGYLYGELGVQYYMQDALGIAVGIHEMVRNSDLFEMANYAQTVNVIGCIKTTKTDAAFETTAYPLMLYRREFGTVPLALTGDMRALDIVASRRDDGKLAIGVVNPTGDKHTVLLRVSPHHAAGRVTCYRLSGRREAYFLPGARSGEEPKLRESVLNLGGGPLELRVAACSMELYVVD
ncbi:MAG: alpha-N-arabinofuranosidase [Candidatus Hydrogenedentes bacterium]|nr:alpha-N-arabinofuranosidase [Candidatus Hydrogenedentota bacterium]